MSTRLRGCGSCRSCYRRPDMVNCPPVASREVRNVRTLVPLLVAFILLSTGCATISIRGPGGPRYPGTYPATRVDAELLHDLYTHPLDPSPPFLWPLWWALYTPPFVLDFAPSIITDTVMFPFDLHGLHKQEEERRERVGPGDEETRSRVIDPTPLQARVSPSPSLAWGKSRCFFGA